MERGPLCREQIPLAWRLPNGASVFVGREGELERLAQVLSRAPVALVWGGAGVGKTALVLESLARQGVQDEALYVSASGLTSLDALCERLSRALTESSPLYAAIDPEATSRQPQATLAAILDAVDAQRCWLVLDDAHALEDEALWTLVQLVARYGRRGRWVVITREPGRSDPSAWVQVSPLARAQAQALVASWQCGDAAVLAREHYDGDTGSLWALERAIWGWRRGAQAPLGVASFAPTPPQRRLLSCLLESVLPLPSGLLCELAQAPREALEGLLAASLVRELMLGVVIEPGCVEALRARFGEPMSDGHLLALGRSAQLDYALEGVRIALKRARYEVVEGILQGRFDALRQAGHLSELWSMLREHDAPQLATWRLRCACALNALDALSAITFEPPRDWEMLSYWINARQLQGDWQAASALAEQADALPAPQDEAQRLWCERVAIQRVNMWLSLGRLAEASAALARLEVHDPWSRVLVMMIGARVALARGERARAVALTREHYEALAQLEPRRRGYWIEHQIFLRYSISEFREAAELARDTLSSPTLPLLMTEHRWVVFAGVFLHSGELALVAQCVARAMSLASGFNLLMARNIGLQLMMYRWDEARWCGWFEQQRDALRRAAHADVAAVLVWVTHQVASLRAMPVVETPEPEGSALTPDYEALTMTARAHHALRTRGALGALAPPPEPVATGGPFVWIPRALCHLMAALCEGEPTLARLDALDREVERRGFALWRLDLLLMGCEVALIERPESLDERAGALRDHAQRCGASRYEAEAALFEVLTQRPVAPEALEHVAATSASPQAARRASALLGREVALDWLDRRVVDAALAWTGWRLPRVLDASSVAEAAWGFDASQQVVWGPASARLDLSRRAVLCALLEALAKRDGVASKEALVEAVWPEVEAYHPLHHDNRLRVAVRKLRAELGEALGEARDWIETTQEGYALARPFHYLSASSQGPDGARCDGASGA